MPLSRKLAAEFIGTFWLVLGGCGSAVLAAAFPEVGIGLAGVSLAFGLTVLTMAYAIGHISGCHLNPAVTVGLWAGGRHPIGEVLPYVVAQVLGGLVGGAVGNALDQKDKQMAQQAAQQAFENARTGEASAWRNPDSGNSGSVTPTRTYQAPSGQYCREYQQEIIVGGEPQKSYGTACRQPDGSWRIQG